MAISLAQAPSALGQARTLYYSGFEAEQDYNIEFTLIDQDGWLGEGTGGNGLVENYFEGMSQQGYIGFYPPNFLNLLNLWRPIKDIKPEETKITFSVLMMIVDSTNGHRDDFRWSVYNRDEQHLVTLDFENETKKINYTLDNDTFLDTGVSFKNETLYDLKFVMDFASNSWTVTLNDKAIVNEEQLTTTEASLTFGDIGPLWVIRKPETPGDNYMVFDEYKITVKTDDQTRTLYYSGFEPEQDYDTEFDLIGQDGWGGEGTGGNGLVENKFEGMGQQGYIGFFSPKYFLNLWRPVEEIKPEETKITFSVFMMIIDSTNGHRDDFRWSVYNSDEQHLVTLNFDNESKNINYALEDEEDFTSTGYEFENEAIYELKFVMDFANNSWTVTVGSEALVNEKQLTTTGINLTFGDLGPLWVIRKPETPGDNYMVFDDYRITVETNDSPPDTPPTLAWDGWTDDGRAMLQLGGDAMTDYTVEVSSDLENWNVLLTGKPGESGKKIEDADTQTNPNRFYRARTAD